jgi:hypothetical protein
MEFLTTYSYVLLIIAIALVVLIAFFTLPRSTIPFQCSFYSGFSCSDGALVLLPSNTASLIIMAVDNMPGIVNVSSFNSVISYTGSSVGYCLPQRVEDGDYIYCIANFPFKPSLTNVYYATFNISANYCAVQAQNLSVVSCPATTNFVFGGSARLQPSTQSSASATLNALIANTPGSEYYSPITITNMQSTATSAPFQVLLMFPNVQYSGYINSQWNNVEFSTLPNGRGAQLEAWVENSPSSAAGNTAVWVNLPDGIAANSNSTIYVEFMSTNIMSAFGPTGEAPQLSAQYAKYDNGAYLFPLYYDFNGTSMPSGLSTNSYGSTSKAVANGITLTATSGTSGFYVYGSTILTTPTIAEALLQTSIGTAVGFQPRVGDATGLYLVSSANDLYPSYTASEFKGSLRILGVNQTGSGTSWASTSYTLNQNTIVGFAWQNTGSEYAYINEGLQLSGTDSNNPVTNYYPFFGIFAPGGVTGSELFQWFRIRAIPPNNIMPSISYGTSVTRGT